MRRYGQTGQVSAPSPAPASPLKPVPVPHADQAAEDRALLNDIRAVHAASQGRYGSPRVRATLRTQGRRVGCGRVERLMRDHLRAELATSALMMAIQRQRPQPGLIQHSDRGIQHACTDDQEVLQAAGITPSMSRRGNALDNAPMESFLHTLKKLVHHRAYATHEEARRDLFAYVEGFYNR